MLAFSIRNKAQQLIFDASVHVQLVFLKLNALVFKFDSGQRQKASIKNSEKEKGAQDVFNNDAKMSDGEITDDAFVLFSIYSLSSYINTIIVKRRLFF